MKKIIFLMLFGIAGMCLQAQTVNIHKKDGSVIRVALKDFDHMSISSESSTATTTTTTYRNFGGTWKVNANGHKGDLIIKQDGNNFTGSILGPNDKITGKVLSDGSVTFTRHSCNQVYKGSFVNGKLVGEFTSGGRSGYKWEASK